MDDKLSTSERTPPPDGVNTLNLSGKLEIREWGEGSCLFLSGMENPLAEVLDEAISGRHVSVRYWTTVTECSKDEAQRDALLYMLGGFADTRFGARYSEITGYLWTDEDVTIGGHDLMQRAYSAEGKYLHLEIVIHP